MKLVKLSLAAVVAAGSLSALSAASLEESIKNVDFSGMLRYRYTSTHEEVKAKTTTSSITKGHGYRADAKLGFGIADDIKFKTQLRYSVTDDGHAGTAAVGGPFGVREAYVIYNKFDTDFNLGRHAVDSMFTDGLLGTGISVVNSSVDGVKLMAYAFDSLNLREGDLYAYEKDPKGVKDIYTNNLFGTAAAFDMGVVKARVDAAHLERTGTFYGVDVNTGLDLDGANVGLHLQYAGNSLTSGKKDPKTHDLANGSFIGAELSAGVAGMDFTLGTVMYGKKDHKTLNSIHDKGQLITAGEVVIDGEGYHGNIVGKHTFIFLTGAMKMDDYGFGLDVVTGSKKDTAGKTNYLEITPRASYQYNKQLKLSGYFAYATADEKATDTKTTTNKLRLEAKYTF